MAHRILLFLSCVLAVCAGLAQAQESPHGKLAIPCERCHTTQGWTPLLSPMAFSHDSTDFRLQGRHTQVSCRSCHRSLDFAEASPACASCHSDIHRGELGKACERCHSPRTWLVPEMADRHRETRFPLLGAHRTAPCRLCHVNEQKYEFAGTPTACFECHRNDYRTAASPNHIQAGFGTDCVQCHAPTALNWGGTFDHNQTAFPLAGAHRAVPCVQCHTGNRFRGTPQQCTGCHLQQYTASVNPPHAAAGFPTDCQQCHTMGGWRPATFNHTTTGFALTGLHATTTCVQCHKNNVYGGTPQTCVACHQQDYNTAANPNHVTSGFPMDCQSCHTSAGWRPATFDHSKTSFPLSGAHRAVTCVQCHKNNVYAGTPTACNSCHQSDYTSAVSPRHTAPSFSTDCTGCHTTTGWRPSTFNHSATRFPLTGAHAAVACATCHKNGIYAGTPLTCVGCHQQDFNTAAAPNHVASGFPTDCVSCHTTTAWQPSSFNHTATAFPLTGAHAAVQCAQCHKNNVYKGTPTQCNSCHQTDYAAVVSPKHTLPSFSTDCTVCHTTAGWRPSSFDHSKTAFALVGGHLAAACNTCHINGVYAGTSTQCQACHLTQYNGTTNPKHTQPAFPLDCQTCHTPAAWSPAVFNHSLTSFPLTGAHVATGCASCHLNGQYAGIPVTCWGCHQTAFNTTTAPAHAAAGFPQQCDVCHNTAAWKPSTFNHATTAFPLTGAHTAVQCVQCHQNNVYKGTPQTCVACHQQDYNKTTNPNHVTSGFPTDCQSCHSTSAWQPANFDHSKTAFPLTGAHAAVTCAQCHKNNVYAGTPTACNSCHQNDYASVATPKHTLPSFSSDCTVCHNTTAWKPSTFSHSTTKFPLSGAHTTTVCASCHVNGVYAGTPLTCVGCHQQNFNGATNPPHAASGFPTDCQTCHSTTAWQPATFDHSTTAFPLTGAHQATACNKCHVNNVYKGTPTQCYACHQADYTGVVTPKHTQPSFTTDCTICHTTTVWKPSTFNHSTTKYPLTGAHVSVACASCHSNGVYAGTSMVCSGCHTADYNGTNNPNHQSAGFPTDCATCHTTTAWSPANWNHDTYFPIGAGSHHSPGRWNTCADCHTVSTDYSVFSCINCHTHDKTTTDSHHTSVRNYSYDSPSCYRCHPKGTSG